MTGNFPLHLIPKEGECDLQDCSDDETICSMDLSDAEDVANNIYMEDDNDIGHHSADKLVDESLLDLTAPMGTLNSNNFLLASIRDNKTLKTMKLSRYFFQAMPPNHRCLLVEAIASVPFLKHVVVDNVWAEFITIFEHYRCWKRDQHQLQFHQLFGFENQSIEELEINELPSHTTEDVLRHLTMLTCNNFRNLKHLSVEFAEDLQAPQAALTRVALSSLCCSRSLTEITFTTPSYSFEVSADKIEGIIRVLKLRCSRDLSPDSFIELSRMLKAHGETLKGLVLDADVDCHGALCLAEALGSINNLKALCLGNFDCQGKGSSDGLLSLISSALCRPKPLQYLSLCLRDLGDKGLTRVSQLLAQSDKLRDFTLLLDNEDETSITSKGIAALADAIRVNQTLDSFTLICNDLEDNGVLAIADAFREENCTLKHLSLQSNKHLTITPLLEMAKRNTNIRSIDVGRSSEEEEDTFGDGEEDIDSQMGDSMAAKSDCRDRIDFYLKLNRAGVRRLNLNIDTTVRQFLHKLNANCNDLDTLFYMLSANPSFI